MLKSIGKQVNKLLCIKSIVPSQLHNFQLPSTLPCDTVKPIRSISASHLIHTDCAKRKSLMGSQQCDKLCNSTKKSSTGRCDDYCQALRDQIETNIRHMAIPKVMRVIHKPCGDFTPKTKHRHGTSVNLSGMKGRATMATKAVGSDCASNSMQSCTNNDVPKHKPIEMKPKRTLEKAVVSKTPSKLEYLKVDLVAKSHRSANEKRENSKLRSTASDLSQRSSDNGCLIKSKSDGDACTLFKTPSIKLNAQTNDCLAIAVSSTEPFRPNRDGKSPSICDAPSTLTPNSHSQTHSFSHLMEQLCESKALANSLHSTSQIRCDSAAELSPCKSLYGSPTTESYGTTTTSRSTNQSTSSSNSSPCQSICNQPTISSCANKEPTSSSDGTFCKTICGSTTSGPAKSGCTSSSASVSLNECSAAEKISVCKLICCQASKEISVPVPRKKLVTASSSSQSITKPKASSCGTIVNGAQEPAGQSICETICNSSAQSGSCAVPKPVVSACATPKKVEPVERQCSPCAQLMVVASKCNDNPKPSSCGSVSKAAVKCSDPAPITKCPSDIPKKGCGSRKCMPSQPLPQKRR